MRIVIASLFCLCFSQNFAQVDFQQDSFPALLAKANKAHKYLMIDAYTDWCGWCKVMDRETFSDSTVSEFINTRFVSTKLNMEEGFGVLMAMKHRVSQYPYYLFFDDQGQLLAKLSGFMKPEAFMEAVHDAVYSQPHLPKGGAPLDFEMDYPDWYRNSFLKNKERSYPTAEQLNTWLNSRESILDEVTWGVMHRFIQGGPWALQIAENRIALMERYGKKEVRDKIAALIFADVKTAIKDKDEQVLEQTMQACESYLDDDAAEYQFRYKLYFYQMLNQWEEYAALINATRSSNPTIANDAALEQSAQSIASRSTNPTALLEALNWIDDLLDSNTTVERLLIKAKILQKQNAYPLARAVGESARDLAISLHLDPKDAEAFLEQLPM